MILLTAPAPARRDCHSTAIREALDRIDELLAPADPGRGLGAVLALVLPHARGPSAQARLALAARCVAQRVRQEAADELRAAAAPFANRAITPPERIALAHRLRRKVRELRLVIELRLPGRLARADEALRALAASSILNDTLRGFVVATACRWRTLDTALVGRLEALMPLLAGRSPLGALTPACTRVGAPGRGRLSAHTIESDAIALFEAFAGANDTVLAAHARLARSHAEQDRSALAALSCGQGLQDLALAAIGSTTLPLQTPHANASRLLQAGLASPGFTLMARALGTIGDTHPDLVASLRALVAAWADVAGWAAGGASPPPTPGCRDDCEIPTRLEQTLKDYLSQD